MNYKFEVTEQEANIFLQALGELPAKISMGLIGKIQSQARVQEQGKAKEKISEEKNNVKKIKEIEKEK